MSDIRRDRSTAVLAAAATAAASWAVATQLAGVHLGVQFPHANPSTVVLGATVGTAAVATVLGWAALYLLERQVSRPRRSWCAVAVAVLGVSLGLPAAFATTTAAAIALAVIHLAVAAVAIIGLGRTASPGRLAGGLATEATRRPQPVA